MQYILVFLTFIVLSIFLNATDTTQDQKAIKILISKIKHSSSEDKRELMNELKIILRKMNQETRKKVMQDLQRSFVAKKNNQSNVSAITVSNTGSSTQPKQQMTIQQPVTIPQTPVIPSRPTIPQNTPFRGGK